MDEHLRHPSLQVGRLNAVSLQLPRVESALAAIVQALVAIGRAHDEERALLASILQELLNVRAELDVRRPFTGKAP